MVKELTAQNFEAALKENKTAVVEFYSKTWRQAFRSFQRSLGTACFLERWKFLQKYFWQRNMR